MAQLDVLAYGFAFVSDQGGFGFSNVSLITVGDQRILVDTGPPSRRSNVYEALQSRGLAPEDIDLVVLTHLHWDHCLNVDMFKNARVLLHAEEIDYIKSPTSKDYGAAFYVADMLDKLRIEPVSEGDIVVPGISIMETPGHTRGHISLVANVDGDTVLVAGDALPDTGTVKRGMPYNIFWDVNDATESVEKMLDASSVFYPGHDRPFKVEGEKISYIDGPDRVELSDSNEGGEAIRLAYRVHQHRAVNIDTVQKP